MRKYALLAAAAAMAVSGSVAQADFIFTHNRTTLTSGMFSGDDVVELDVQNDGKNGTGTTLLAATVTFESVDPTTSKVVPGQFFIRTFDQDGSGNLDDADVSNQSGNAAGSFGTYARFGNTSQWTLAGAMPDNASSDDPGGPHGMGQSNYPASGKYTDGLKMTGPLTVIGGANLTTGGLNDATSKPLAFAVVPHGQPVRFDVNVAGATGASYVGPPIDDPPIPEPASIGLLGFGLLGLMRRRRA